MSHPTRTLAAFLAALDYPALPERVVARSDALCLDWLGSALAGKGQPPIPLFERYAQRMGPATGASESLTDRRLTSPHFAALVNAAASHVVEQDDLHNSSVLHPGTVVFPAALAAAQELGFDEDRFVHVLGSAGTQAGGLWEFLRDGAHSKQLHTAKAAADGLLAAYLTADDLTGAQRILDGRQGMAAGMSRDADPGYLTDRLGERWALEETSFKFHASCRHTHPAADALLALMQAHGLGHDDIEQVTARVHQAAIDVLGPVTRPISIRQAKFSMGTVLGLIAVHGRAGLEEFQRHALKDAQVIAFRERVNMQLDPEVDAAYPKKWLGRVTVTARAGRTLSQAIDDPEGDPGNTLSREELEDKFRRLAAFSGAASPAEAQRLIDWAWQLREQPRIVPLLQAREETCDSRRERTRENKGADA